MKQSINDKRVHSHVVNILSRYKWADREMVQSKLSFALRHAAQSYDPSFGMNLSEYEDLCLMNCRNHQIRQLAAEAKRRGVTSHLDVELGDDNGRFTFSDLLVDSRNTARRQIQILALREFFGKLHGTVWSVCVAVLAGYNRSEIARHLKVPRSSFDRIYGPILEEMKEVANG